MSETIHYEVALSFAGEDRQYAEQLYDHLTQSNVRVFYDNNEQAELWGKNLYDYFTDLYLNRARFCVMLISQHYARKMWANHERRVAQARAFRENQEYILPVRLDETDIPGVLSTVGHLSWPPEDAASIAQKIVAKLGTIRQLDRPFPQDEGTPTRKQLVFQRDNDSVLEFERKSVVRKAVTSWILAPFAAVLSSVGFLFAWVAASPDGPQLPIRYVLASFAGAMVLAIAALVLWSRTEDHRRLYSYKEPTGRMGKYIGQGRFAKRKDDGRYVVYKMSVPCSYSTCDGTVYINNYPSNQGTAFTGSCNLDKYRHTYEVDANGLAIEIGRKFN